MTEKNLFKWRGINLQQLLIQVLINSLNSIAEIPLHSFITYYLPLTAQ